MDEDRKRVLAMSPCRYSAVLRLQSTSVRLRQKAAIVFLSQHNSRAVARAAPDTGALGYVVKSAATDDLVPAIKAAAKGKIFVSRVE